MNHRERVTYEAPPAAVAFIETVAGLVPAAGLRIQDERRFHAGVVHPHLEMGAVATWFLSAWERSRANVADSPDAAYSTRKLLDVLETHFETGRPEVDDVISGSFLENLQGHRDLVSIRSALPPKLARFYALYIAQDADQK